MQPERNFEMSFDRQEFRAIGYDPEQGRSKAAAGHEFARPDRSKTIAFLLAGLLTTAVLSGCAGQNSDLVAKVNSAYGTAFTVGSSPIEVGSAAN
jgi:hypothetical protein